jgi:hypothetical protein
MTAAFEITVADCVPDTSPAKDPEKLVAEVAVAALPVQDPELPLTLPVTLPVNAPVNVVAATCPLPSLFIIVDTVLAAVAALAANSALCILVALEVPTAETTVAP